MLIHMALVAAAAAAAVPAPEAASPAYASINAFYEEITRERTKDIRNAAKAFHPSGLFVFMANRGQPGPVTTGTEMGARMDGMAKRMAADGMTISSAYRIERRSVIGNVAVDTGYLRSTQTRNGTSQPFYARFLVTMVRGTDGRWKIVSDASWPATEEAWNAVPRTAGLKYDA